MATTTIGDYDFPPANRQANYGDDWNIYIGWAQHLMYPCPSAYRVPPDIRLRDFLETMFRPDYMNHPDTPKLDFDQVEWTYEGKRWQPDLDKSLRDNGLEHMSYVSFRSPGLEGLHGVGN
ncbi:MAG: phenol hydroxylase [Gammaproteobacteria bacterium]|nr:phenol hydroxylase [Gammaproteobacteria bacterium]